MIKSSKEVKAFRCPICDKLIEISNSSKEYIVIHGSLTYGEREHMNFIGENKEPIRICTYCLIKKLGGMPIEIIKDKFETPSGLNQPDDIKDKKMSFIGMPKGIWDIWDKMKITKINHTN